MDFLLNYGNYIIQFTIDNFLISILIYFIFLFIYSVFSFPGLFLFVIFSGYLYGIYYGYIISIISLCLGTLCFYYFSKYFFKYFFVKYYKKFSMNVNNYLSNSSIEYLIIFRLIPGTPLFLQNILLSLINISGFKFIFVTFLGFTPLFFTLSYLGDKFKDIQSINNFILLDVFTFDFIIIITLIIFFLLLRIIYKNKKSPR